MRTHCFKYQKVFHQKAFTIIELLIVMLALTIVLGVVTRIYFVGSNLWATGLSRSDVRTELVQSMELMTNSLRRARSIDSLTESSITFTADLGSGVNTYRFYLYHASDAEPNPPYSQNTYDLRWAQEVVTYGAGANLSRNIVQPTSAAFSQSGDVISIDLTAMKNEQSIRMRSKVRPRNL